MPTSATEQPAVLDKTGRGRRFKVLYLTTTFPKLTETFIQREVNALRSVGVDVEVFSLWGGDAQFEGIEIRRFPKVRLLSLLWMAPYWMIRRPKAIFGLGKELATRPMPSWKNLGEVLVGAGFALTHAPDFAKSARETCLVHAAWATMPATAAQLLSTLTSRRFSMGAHAYDVYQNGGDWLLSRKLDDAALVVTSTCMVREELLHRGADPDKVVVVRRGLNGFPKPRFPRTPRKPLRILSVSRLVEKKGVLDQIQIFAEMMRDDIAFEARIVGDGPMAAAARTLRDRLKLGAHVSFLGSVRFDGVLEQYAWADVLLSTGLVAADGDRDGFPNVVLEAMAYGIPIVARRSEAIAELIEDGKNGVLIPAVGTEEWIQALVRLSGDDAYYHRLCRNGRRTVERYNDALANARTLLEHFVAAAAR